MQHREWKWVGAARVARRLKGRVAAGGAGAARGVGLDGHTHRHAALLQLQQPHLLRQPPQKHHGACTSVVPKTLATVLVNPNMHSQDTVTVKFEFCQEFARDPRVDSTNYKSGLCDKAIEVMCSLFATRMVFVAGAVHDCAAAAV